MLDIKCTSGFIANERFLVSYSLQNEGSLLIVPTFRFNPLLKCTWIPYSDLKFCYKRVLRQVTVVISKKYRSSKKIFLPHTFLSSSTSRHVWFGKNELRGLSQKSEAQCYAALAHQRSSAQWSRENSFFFLITFS